MIDGAIIIRPLSSHEAHARAPALAGILIDCVEGGASVSFMTPLSQQKAQAFWHAVADGIAEADRSLLVAEDSSTGSLVGTVQLVLGQPENQPHRADIAKMLVHRAARKQGIGARLMQAAEDAARDAGKTLLVLDTATGGDAERLYQRLGWIRVGTIPGYAVWPDGQPCATTYYYKQLLSPAR